MVLLALFSQNPFIPFGAQMKNVHPRSRWEHHCWCPIDEDECAQCFSHLLAWHRVCNDRKAHKNVMTSESLLALSILSRKVS